METKINKIENIDGLCKKLGVDEDKLIRMAITIVSAQLGNAGWDSIKSGREVVPIKGEDLVLIRAALVAMYNNQNEKDMSKTTKESKSIEPIWNIKDAKPGDVLANKHHILILKELDYDWYSNGYPYSVHAYCGIKPNGNFELGKEHWCFCGTLYMRPATSEERDLLFAKMREAGYEWDADKKELKKITE